MKLMLKWGLLAAVLTTFVGTAVPAQAITFVANPCLGGKLACVTKKKACLLGCYKKATGGTAVSIDCLTKCRGKFDGAGDPAKACFAKLEAKYLAGCATTGDVDEIECKVDGFVQGAIGQLINSQTLAGDANKCLAGKINSLIGYNKCRLGVITKAAKGGGAPDSAKLQKCTDKINAAYPKLETKYPPASATPCTSFGDVGAVVQNDNLFLDDLVAELLAGQKDMNTQRCTGDTSVKCTSAPGGLAGCGGPLGTCEFWFGSNLPLSAGGVATCATNQWNGGISGTANIQTGASAGSASVLARVYTGITNDQPCPQCVETGNQFPNDGVLGICNGGTRNGMACDINGLSPNPSFGGTSLDCPPSGGGLIATLPIDLSNANNATVALTIGASSPVCNGKPGKLCACSSCSAPPPGVFIGCRNDADCIAAGAGLCTSAAGEARKPNACIDDTTTVPDEAVCTDVAPVGDGEGACLTGPADQHCKIESQKGCTVLTQAVDCPAPGDTCVAEFRPCFLDNGNIGGQIQAQGKFAAPINHWSHPTFGSVFCIAPTTSASVNTVAGLPGAGRLELEGEAIDNGTSSACPTQATFLPTSKGGVLDTGWTGIAHNATAIGQGKVTVALSGCTPFPACQCNYTGPIPNANALP